MARKLGITFLIFAVLLSAFVWSNPLRRPEPFIRLWLEKTTPLDSDISEVRATAEQRGWYYAHAQGSDGNTTGTYVRGELGDYRGLLLRTSVTVFWEFDGNNRLENIRIWKTTDGP